MQGVRGIISRCVNTKTITGNDKVGGIAGYSGQTINNCYNRGSANEKIYGKNNYTGGIVGWSNGVINNCANYMIVEGTNQWAGGITGTNYKPINQCLNKGTIKITTWNAGGITGWNQKGAGINFCYNTGDVTCSSYYSPFNGSWSAGIAATSNANITYCYNVGAIYGYSRCVGRYLGGSAEIILVK